MAIAHTVHPSGYAVQIQRLLWYVDIFTDPDADLYKCVLSDCVYCSLGTFNDLQKGAFSIVMSVHSSACLSAWNSWVPIGQTVMKSNI